LSQFTTQWGLQNIKCLSSTTFYFFEDHRVRKALHNPPQEGKNSSPKGDSELAIREKPCRGTEYFLITHYMPASI
jgi:hypothetical protein